MSYRLFVVLILLSSTVLAACSPVETFATETGAPTTSTPPIKTPTGFASADGSNLLTFPADFGAHPDYRTEWWYYTGNLDTKEGRHFGFELTIFRVGLQSPAAELPQDSQWYSQSLYFAHFALSDIQEEKFYAFERYSRPGPGLAGAEADPYHVWTDDWNITQSGAESYRLQAAQGEVAIDLSLADEMGVILHGENGYSRKGKEGTNASYYYSQPRLRAEGSVQVDGITYPVSGLVWKDHEFSTSVLDENQIGWDWFSLQFENGSALMLFQLRERDASISPFSSGTFVSPDGNVQSLEKDDFQIIVFDTWRSPHTAGVYPSEWQIELNPQNCQLTVQPWMNDQEVHFTTVTYWEGAVRFEGMCGTEPVKGNGYIEMTGYAGRLPLP